MYKYKRNGFTLVELMAVIIIISLIALLTFPNIINQIKKTKKSNNKMIEDVIIEQAKKYVSDNSDKYDSDSENTYCISINELINDDYIKDDILEISDNDIVNKKVIKLTYDKKFNYILVNNNDCENIIVEKLIDSEGERYKKVSFIRTTGTQYINTNYYPDEYTNAEYKVQLLRIKEYGPHLLSSKKYYFPLIRQAGGNQVLVNRGGTETGINSYTKNKEQVYYFKAYVNNKIVINDEEFETIGFTSGKDTVPLYLGTYGGSPTYDQALSNAKFYFCRIYDGEVLKRDYVPVIDKKNRPCMFDKVEKKCYYNQGTGEFLYE